MWRRVAVDEDAAAAAPVAGLRVVHPAERALVDEVLRGAAFLAEHRAHLDVQLLARLLTGVVHRLRVGPGSGHRLLAEHVLARLEGCDGHGHVQEVGETDVHRVQLLERKHIAVIGKHMRDAVLRRDALGLVLIQVGYCHKLDIVAHLSIAANVALPDDPRADDSGPYLACHLAPFPTWFFAAVAPYVIRKRS